MQLGVLDESDRNCSFDCFDKNFKYKIGRNEFISFGSRFVFFNLGRKIVDFRLLERCLLPTTCCTSLQSSPPNPEAVV